MYYAQLVKYDVFNQLLLDFEIQRLHIGILLL